MAALTIVKYFNVVKNVGSSLSARSVFETIYPFRLQGMEEALHRSVVPTISLTAHAADKAVNLEFVLIVFTGILAASVRMMDDPIGL